MKREFASQRYYREIIQAMQLAGFEFFSLVRIDTNDRPYHVNCLEARNTGLFFHVPGKALIVQLDLNEVFCEEGQHRHHWSLDVYAQGNIQEFWKKFLGAEEGPMDDEDERWPREPWDLFSREVNGLRNGGGMYAPPGCDRGKYVWGAHSSREFARNGVFEDAELLTIDEVVKPVANLLDEIRQILRGPFTELQVTGFPPHYTFRGCEPIFWSRFNLLELKAKVTGRIWGSDGIS